MGWKGTLRTVNAELKRQSREADKRHRQHLKALEIESAADTVDKQETYLEAITTLHTECVSFIDWKEPQPNKPENLTPLTNQAQNKYSNFKPNLVDKILRIENWRKNKLYEKIEIAKTKDHNNYQKAVNEFKFQKKAWEKKQNFLERMKNDPDAIIECLQEYLDVTNLSLSTNIGFEVSESMLLEINLKVLPIDQVIPEDKHTLRQSGTLSTKKMSKGESWEIYRDYVCSALIRIAREVLEIVPFDRVRANVIVPAVNPQTGHLEDQVIISSIIMKETLDQLNFKYLNPSDSLNNFIHNIKFRKTKGFEIVDRVSFPER